MKRGSDFPYARKPQCNGGPTGVSESNPHIRASEIERALIDSERRLARHLGERRMRVADARDVLARRTEFHRDDALGDQLARLRPDDVHAEDAIGLRIGDELDETGRVAERAGAAVRRERKHARTVRDAVAPPLLPVAPDPRDLRRRLNHPTDSAEI